MKLGIIYFAMYKRYYAEALESVKSLKLSMPDTSVTLFTRGCGVAVSSIFDTVLVADDVPPYHAKIKAMIRSPYDRTLYLDSDTRIYGDLQDIFTLLDRFDIAAAHAPIRQALEQGGLPNSFPEYNTGVVAYRDNTKVRHFLDSWDDLFEQIYSIPHDQPSFRHALYNSDLRVATLPSEYNCRMCIGGYVHDKIKILHTRKLLPSLEFVNKVGPRAYVRGEVLEE